MNYKDSYGKLVDVKGTADNWGKPLNKNKQYVVTRYIDRDSETVGIVVKTDEYTVDELLQTQPMTHEVYVKDLVELG